MKPSRRLTGELGCGVQSLVTPLNTVTRTLSANSAASDDVGRLQSANYVLRRVEMGSV